MTSSESYLSYFTPGQMTHETLEFILVKRQKLIERLVERVRNSVTTEAKHQTVLLGPRGMGKSHVVALVYHRVKAMEDLADKVVIAWLAEEEWGVASLTDLFLVILKALAREYPQSGLQAEIDALYRLPYNQVGDAAGQKLRNFANNRTLFIVAENLEEIFRGLGDPGQWAFRSFLSEDPFVTILATTPSLFTAIQKQTEAFYGFFQHSYLEELDVADATELLGKVAERRGDERLAQFIKTPAAKDRVQAVHDLAGGHPRIYLLFAHLITQESLDELVTPFLKLLDELTPYYQSRMQLLSPQQRKIAEFLCDRRGAITVKDIAAGNLLTSQIAAKQLGDLERMGYVRKTAVGRESFYELREPLLRMVIEMKRGRGEPLRLVVDFLRRWYSRHERRERLTSAPESAELTRQYWEASLDLERAFQDSPDPERARELTSRLRNAQNSSDFSLGIDLAAEIIEKKGSNSAFEDWWNYAYCLHGAEDFDGALKSYDRAIELRPDDADTWHNRGIALRRLARYSEALDSYDRAIELRPDDADTWYNRGIALGSMARYSEALDSYDRAIELRPDDAGAWNNRGIALGRMARYSEALDSFDKALELRPHHASTWYNRGYVLDDMARYSEALDSYGKALEIRPDHADTWYNRGIALGRMARYSEALDSYDRALELRPDDAGTWNNRGIVLDNMARSSEALDSYDRALELRPDHASTWYNRGIALDNMDRYSEALDSYDRALELKPDYADAMLRQAAIALRRGDWESTITLISRGLELSKRSDEFRGDTDAYCRIMFRTHFPAERRMIEDLIRIYSQHDALPQLSHGFTKSISSVLGSEVSSGRAEEWLASWTAASQGYSDMDIPLRLLAAAVAWKPKRDPRALLAISAEERRILEQMLP